VVDLIPLWSSYVIRGKEKRRGTHYSERNAISLHYEVHFTMNLLILNDDQWTSSNTALACPRQSLHIAKILKCQIGDRIAVGQLNGQVGSASVASIGKLVQLDDIILDRDPSPALPLTLILGMPRPQMLKRILQTVATLGVRKLCLIQTSRVEKSFWQSPSAKDDAIAEQLLLGLEQGGVTHAPVVEKHQRFRPFIEDHLAGMAKNSLGIIAHPGAPTAAQEQQQEQAITLAIGPEGGFIEGEVEGFVRHGFNPVHLGRRIMKVETAVPVLLTKLYPFVLS